MPRAVASLSAKKGKEGQGTNEVIRTASPRPPIRKASRVPRGAHQDTLTAKALETRQLAPRSCAPLTAIQTLDVAPTQHAAESVDAEIQRTVRRANPVPTHPFCLSSFISHPSSLSLILGSRSGSQLSALSSPLVPPSHSPLPDPPSCQVNFSPRAPTTANLNFLRAFPPKPFGLALPVSTIHIDATANGRRSTQIAKNDLI